MKKFLAFSLCVLTAGVAIAQDWDFSSSKSSGDIKRNQFAIEIGAGGGDDIIVDLGIRWQMNFGQYVAWDVLTLKALADVQYEDNIFDATALQLLTGVRGTSPVFYKNISSYLTAKAGYAVCSTDISGDGEFAFELGLGFNLGSHFYFGYAFNNCGLQQEEWTLSKKKYYSAAKTNVHSLRIGYAF